MAKSSSNKKYTAVQSGRSKFVHIQRGQLERRRHKVAKFPSGRNLEEARLLYCNRFSTFLRDHSTQQKTPNSSV